MAVDKKKTELKKYYCFMEDIIDLLKRMDLFQDEIISRPSSIKEDLKNIIRIRSCLIDNYDEYDISEKSEEIYGFLLRKGYLIEDLENAQIKLGPTYFKELQDKKIKKSLIANLLLGFGLGFFLNT